MAQLSNNDLLDVFKEMTLLELTDFMKMFEETFDVTATAPVAISPIVLETEPVEEQTEFDVILEAAGDKKIGVIKVVREIAKGLGLKEAKDLVDSAPKPVLQQVTRGAADDAAARLQAAGAIVAVK
jgi:large subunit ribosomal protein L7/L12